MIDKKITNLINLISNLSDDEWAKKQFENHDEKQNQTNNDKQKGSNDSTSSDEDELSIHKHIWKILKSDASNKGLEFLTSGKNRQNKHRSISPSNESTIMNKIKQEILDRLESKSTENLKMDENGSEWLKVVSARDRTYSHNGYSASEIYGTLALFENKASNRFKKQTSTKSATAENNTEKHNSTKVVNECNEIKKETNGNAKTVGLNQDLLMKFDQQNMQKASGSDLHNPGSMISYYQTASMIYNNTNTNILKTTRPKKTTRLMPSKKYLSEMLPIKVLVKLNEDDRELRYVQSQVTLSKDI